MPSLSFLLVSAAEKNFVFSDSLEVSLDLCSCHASENFTAVTGAAFAAFSAAGG
jgi:hypothetical protein